MITKPANRIRISPEHGRRAPLAVCLTVGLTVMYLSPTAQAAVFIWDGGASNTNNWATESGKNWNTKTTPPSDGTANLQFAGSARTSPNMEISYNINSMTFNSGASPFTLGNSAGAVLTIQGGGIANADDSIQTTNISAIVLGASQSWNAGTVAGGSLVFGGATLNLGTSHTLTVAGSNNTSIANAISGSSSGILKTGNGTLTLTGANSFTGTTVIAASGGTLTAGAVNALQNTSAITVNSSGTLLLAGAGAINRVNNAAGFTLAGGKLSTAGLSTSSETLGSLTLSANSTIDFGSGFGDQLTFTGVGTHTAGSALSILNWSGIGSTLGISTSDRLIFNGTVTDFTNVYSQADVSFGGFGTGYRAISFNSNTQFEIVAIPEPATIFGALALLGLVGYRERRRLAVLIRPRAQA